MSYQDDFYYESGLTGKLFKLSIGDDAIIADSAPVHRKKWSYNITKNRLRLARRNLGTIKLRYASNVSSDDEFTTTLEADLVSGKNGKLHCNGWQIEAVAVEDNTQQRAHDTVAREVTFALLDSSWWRIGMKQFQPGSSSVDTTPGLNYEYTFEHNYSKPSASGSVDTGLLVPSKPLLTFYGAAVNPYIVLGGNRYQVYTTLLSTDRLVIDGRKHTVTKINNNGVETNLFPNARRGSGLGSGEYIFEPIPTGVIGMAFDDSFGVDVGWYEEAGEPTWKA